MLTKSLILLIFRFGSGLYFATKNTVHKIYVESKKRFFKAYLNEASGVPFSKRLRLARFQKQFVIRCFTTKSCTFVEKIYRRHNNLLTGVLWRTFRSNITSRIFWFWKKDILVRGNFTFWRIENWYLFFVTFCNLTAQSGKRRE